MEKEELKKEYNLTENQYLDIDEVGGTLHLSSLTSIPEGFNPTVGGSLWLNHLTSIPEGFNPTVGGGLDLRRLTSIPEGFNPTVGGALELNGLECNYTKLEDKLITWESGYLSVDGIFGKILSHKGNIWELGEINSDKIFYLVSDNEGSYSHGATLQEAKEDLIYKITNIDKSEYKSFTLETELTFGEAVRCYRVITGACSFGVKDFVNKNNINKNIKYKIKTIIKLSKDEYQNEVFTNYFN